MSSAFRPPHSQRLSAGVIGDVLLRGLIVSSADKNLRHSRSPLPLPSRNTLTETSPSATPPPPLMATKATSNTKTPTRRQRPAAQSNAPNSIGRDKQDSANEQASRRERNRRHQATHKLKQSKYVTDLETAVDHLKEEIQELKMKRQLIALGVPTNASIWSVAAEFFRLFRHSVRPPTDTLEAIGSEYNVQREFLRSTMTSDVTDGAVCGVDTLLQTWAIQSRCYEEIDLQPVRMEMGPGNVLVASTMGTRCINANTLRFAFPHLIRDGNGQLLRPRCWGSV